MAVKAGIRPLTIEQFLRQKREQIPINLPSNPWSLNNSMSWQLCCWQDYQHNTSEKDPSCPISLEERVDCAAKRLCHDFSIVGTRETLSNYFVYLGELMGCQRLGKSIGDEGHMANPSVEKSFGKNALHTMNALLGNLAADEAVYLAGSRIATGQDTSFCEELKSRN